MKTIWKYELKILDIQSIQIPHDADILSIQVQRKVPCLWVLQNPADENIERHIEIFGTGHRIQEEENLFRDFIGTFQLNQGGLVFHAFERL